MKTPLRTQPHIGLPPPPPPDKPVYATFFTNPKHTPPPHHHRLPAKELCFFFFGGCLLFDGTGRFFAFPAFPINLFSLNIPDFEDSRPKEEFLKQIFSLLVPFPFWRWFPNTGRAVYKPILQPGALFVFPFCSRPHPASAVPIFILPDHSLHGLSRFAPRPRFASGPLLQLFFFLLFQLWELRAVPVSSTHACTPFRSLSPPFTWHRWPFGQAK